ncbi:MAG: 4,5-DOPA dioxygenase extradiol [Bacteroidetes bacterium]|nr:4,5-DOPA dioxygenase extradiol [Bacteroidota bacterium]
MNRRDFIHQSTLAGLGVITTSSMINLNAETEPLKRMPALFIGHGSPMNAIEQNVFHQEWQRLGRELPRPKAILCVSAHWMTPGTKVTAMEIPKTIYDFYGFPQALYDAKYPAPGAPQLADQTAAMVKSTTVARDLEWGLDHGTWSVLLPMFPMADIPVYQLSLDMNAPPAKHYEIGKELSALRNQGVLIIGSGNMVHNLGRTQWTDTAYDWAREFDERCKMHIESGDVQPLVDYPKMGSIASLSIPTAEHYLPLLYILGMKEEQEPLCWFNEQVTMGSISMRSLILGCGNTGLNVLDE